NVRLVIGCSHLDEVPDWVRDLAPNEREILQLGTLSHAELLSLLEAHLGGAVLGSTVRALGSSAGFVPGIIVDISRVLERAGVLSRVDGTWALTAPIDAELFVPMLENRMASLTSAARELFLNLCLVGSAELSVFDA